jgi:hypothetical protein
MASKLFYSPQNVLFSSRSLPAGASAMYFFYTGTTTLAPIYSDIGLITPLLNPVTADGLGRLPNIYVDDTITYRIRAVDSNGVPMGTDTDPYVPGTATFTGPAGPTGATGAAGATGATGAKGDKGDTGAAGSSSNYLSGITAPSANDGAAGDIWDDTAAKVIYGPKTGGSWGIGRKYSTTVAASKITYHDFVTGLLPSWLTITRAQGSTDAFYDDAPGRAYSTVAANQPVFWRGGLWRGGSSKNWFLNSTAPVTQTITLAAGSYAMYGNGTGTMTSAAGTAVGTGFGALALSNRSYQIFTITTGGTVTITVAGSVNWAMVANDAATATKATLGPLIVTAGSAVVRNADVATVGGTALTALQSSAATIVIETSNIEVGANGTDSIILSQNNNAQISYANGTVLLWNGGGYFTNGSYGDAKPLATTRTRWGVAFSAAGITWGAGTRVPTVTTADTWPSPTSAYLGGDSTTTPSTALNGVIHRAGFTTTRLSDADLYAEYSTFVLDDAATKTPVYSAAKRALLAGTAGDIVVLFWGTSHFAGTTPATNTKATSFPMLWANVLAASGVPTASDANYGNGSQALTAGISTYDSTVTFSAGLTYWGNCIGGGAIRLTASGHRIDKAVPRITDGIRVRVKRSLTGTPSLTIGLTGGGSTTTFTLANNDLIQTFTITVPRLANNSFRMAWASGDLTIIGWEPTDSLVPVVQVINGGMPSQTSVNLNQSDVLASVAATGAAMIVYGASTNDWATAVGIATSRAAQISNITFGQTVGDVVVLTDPPSATSVAAYSVQAGYNDALVGAANGLGAPVIDLFGSMKGLYSAWNANGYYTDTIHLNYTWGYPMVSALIAASVL